MWIDEDDNDDDDEDEDEIMRMMNVLHKTVERGNLWIIIIS